MDADAVGGSPIPHAELLSNIFLLQLYSFERHLNTARASHNYQWESYLGALVGPTTGHVGRRWDALFYEFTRLF